MTFFPPFLLNLYPWAWYMG